MPLERSAARSGGVIGLYVSDSAERNSYQITREGKSSICGDEEIVLAFSYWWCAQGRNFAYELNAGSIWAPKRDIGKLHHWDAVNLVRKGDIIFSYVRQEIVAIGTAISDPELRDRPIGNTSGVGNRTGYHVAVSYSVLELPIKLLDVPKDDRVRLAVKNGPLNKNLTGVQGYLFSIPSEVGERLLVLARAAVNTDPREI